MLEKQSLGDFIDRINSDKAVIVSVSPQSRASLAAFFSLSQSQVITWACHIHSPVIITLADMLLQMFPTSYLLTPLNSGSQKTDCFVQVDWRKGRF
jgi:hypothetical protein